MTIRHAVIYPFFILYLAIFIEIALRLFSTEIPQLVNRFHSDSWYRLELMHSAQNISRKNDLMSGVFGHAQYHPILGWALIPGWRETQVRGQYSINTNSQGIRGLVEYPYEKNPARKRILMIGDSFTCGDEVSDDETYPAQLAEMLPAAEVINLGVNGYGHDQMLLYLKEEGLKYKPDIVVLGFVESDMARNLLSIMHYPKPKYEISSGTLHLTNLPVPTFASVYNNEVYKSKLVDMLNMIFDAVKARYFRNALIREREQITTGILDEMVRIILANGAKPLFVYIFTPQSMHKMLSESQVDSENFFLNFCNMRDIDCLSTRRYFQDAIASRIELKQAGHWDATGNKIIARSVYEHLF